MVKIADFGLHELIGPEEFLEVYHNTCAPLPRARPGRPAPTPAARPPGTAGAPLPAHFSHPACSGWRLRVARLPPGEPAELGLPGLRRARLRVACDAPVPWHQRARVQQGARRSDSAQRLLSCSTASWDDGWGCCRGRRGSSQACRVRGIAWAVRSNGRSVLPLPHAVRCTACPSAVGRTC